MTGEVPVDVAQDVVPGLVLSLAPDTFDVPRRTGFCQVEPILVCRVVGDRAEAEDEVVLGREMAPLKLKLGLLGASC